MRQRQIYRQRQQAETAEQYAEWLDEVWYEPEHTRTDEISRDALNVADAIAKEVN